MEGKDHEVHSRNETWLESIIGFWETFASTICWPKKNGAGGNTLSDHK